MSFVATVTVFANSLLTRYILYSAVQGFIAATYLLEMLAHRFSAALIDCIGAIGGIHGIGSLYAEAA
jgi:hypothetical protein